jgi:ribosomal protein S18 acetylase RimI-like enzyme
MAIKYNSICNQDITLVNLNTFREQDIYNCALLIGTVFSQYEPQSVHWKLTKDDLVQWSYEMLCNSLPDKLSTCIVYKGKVIGCIVVSKMTRNVNTFPIPPAQPIFNMTKDIINRSKDVTYYIPDETAYIHIAAIDSSYSKAGLCTQLISHVIERAKIMNYKWIMSELTSPGTQHIMLDKLNFQEISVIDYNDYGQGFEGCQGKTVLALKNINPDTTNPHNYMPDCQYLPDLTDANYEDIIEYVF